MSKGGYVYIMTNKGRSTLYIGVTSNLCRRIGEHKTHFYRNSFTARYNLEICIYFEQFSSIIAAIEREKEIKKWNRQKKEALINKNNPEWKELVTGLGFIREYTSFTDQVDDFISEQKTGSGIPPSSE
jgi:putative endonuclease